MDIKEPAKEALVAAVLPAVAVVFVIFFLVMPKVRENRQEQSDGHQVTPPVVDEADMGIVDNFDDCINAGGPIMESYPRQCRHGDQTFVEELEESPDEAAARLAAMADASCTEVGELAASGMFNPNSRTWWFDLMRGEGESADGCAPACVVKQDTGEVEVNWRCTGLRTD